MLVRRQTQLCGMHMCLQNVHASTNLVVCDDDDGGIDDRNQNLLPNLPNFKTMTEENELHKQI